MSKFNRQINTAQRLIRKNGVLLTFTREVAGTVDVVEETETDEEPLIAQGWSVVLPPTTQTEQTYQSQFIAQSLKFSDVKRLLVACKGMSFIPIETDDKVTIRGEEWFVLGGKDLDPDASGTPIIAEVTIKR